MKLRRMLLPFHQRGKESLACFSFPFEICEGSFIPSQYGCLDFFEFASLDFPCLLILALWEKKTTSQEIGKKILPVKLEKPPGKGTAPRKASPPDQKGKGEKPLDPRQVVPLQEGDFKSL